MSKEYRSVPADQVLARFSGERLDKINARALQLVAEEVGLTELRKTRHLTQQDVAAKLGGKQAHVSRLEKRTDVKVSSLRVRQRARCRLVASGDISRGPAL
jgi:DNA-directed RNA polymerase specialized sigma subunit